MWDLSKAPLPVTVSHPSVPARVPLAAREDSGPVYPGSVCHSPDSSARWQTANAFLSCLGVGQIRWHELEALGCCRGAQRAVEGREFRTALVDAAHSQGSGQLDCVISSKAMRCAQPGRLVQEAP